MNMIKSKYNQNWLHNNSTGKCVKVAVIDSGIDSKHPLLEGNVAKAYRVTKEEKVVSIPLNTPPANYHGTGVAGIIKEIAPDVRITNIMVLNTRNSCTLNQLCESIEFAINEEHDVINISAATTIEKTEFMVRLHKLCEIAYQKNIILVASQDNFSPFGYPAKLASIIGVGMSDNDDDSNDISYKPNSFIEFEAFGKKVKVANPGGGYKETFGTSFATPKITGLISLIRERWPNLPLDEVRTLLKSFSEIYLETESYKPNPVSLNKISLNEQQRVLLEHLSKNNHEVWADKRMADGWVYGLQRDDVKKTTPCLVSYEDLEEQEKSYDRDIADTTIQCLLSSGYHINLTNLQDLVEAKKQSTINESYKPLPIDTANIEFDNKFSDLVKFIGRNNHDCWAISRIQQGWGYGPQRNDERKEHPCLVSYDDLCETEKEYDLAMAVGTIKLIIKFGGLILEKIPQEVFSLIGNAESLNVLNDLAEKYYQNQYYITNEFKMILAKKFLDFSQIDKARDCLI